MRLFFVVLISAVAWIAISSGLFDLADNRAIPAWGAAVGALALALALIFVVVFLELNAADFRYRIKRARSQGQTPVGLLFAAMYFSEAPTSGGNGNHWGGDVSDGGASDGGGGE